MNEEFHPHRKTNLIFVFLLTFSIFLLTARLGSYVKIIKNFLFYVIIPTPRFAANVYQASHNLSSNIKGIVKAHQENQKLREMLEYYRLLEDEWAQIQEENIRLKNVFNLSQFKNKKIVVAKVVSREPGSWFQWIIIDKGKEDQLFIDAPVLTWQDKKLCALGRIGEVFNESSKVILITNALSALPVLIEPVREDGLLEGQNAFRLRANYLTPKKKFALGNKVVTSPLSSVFPPGIMIGSIVDFAESEDERFSSVEVESIVNFNNLREVIVLIPEGK
ncbi:MAG: rod shape-determining protein MreC [Endomicrobiales bacterium]|nr:rod shape-determining protein MreC [Endomicrobiales bacterium]